MRSFTGLLVGLLIVMVVAPSSADEVRTWKDSTGKFSIKAELDRVENNVAYLRSTEGKMLKIGVDRLSEEDREYIAGRNNPFEMVGNAGSDSSPFGSAQSTGSSSSDSTDWSAPWKVDWDQVRQLDKGFGDDEWKYEVVSNELSFEPKRVTLPKKTNFFEGIRRLKFNAASARAVAGYTVSFSVPKPLSRISLVDLASGRAINSEQVECNMCPLALMNDGKTVLMHGTGKERENSETGDQLQIWRLMGKKVWRSPIWIPFPDDNKSFGKTTNGVVHRCMPLDEGKALLVGSGRLVCVDLLKRKPIWHTRLGRNYALEMTLDGKHLLLLEEQRLSLVDPIKGETRCSLLLDGKLNMAWSKMSLSPSGQHLMISFLNEIRVLDLATGTETAKHVSSDRSPICPNGLSFPEEDFALLDNHLLFHIPSKIMVCDYRDAGIIRSFGGTEFIGMLSDSGGLIVPSSIPHPKAQETLDQAVNDPSVFLIHPGVEVALDTSGVDPRYQREVEAGLKAAIERAGYQLNRNAALVVSGSISPPKQEAVSYIARGSYIATKITSQVTIKHQGKPVWSRSASNIPGMLSTQRGQSIQDRLNELGQKPNLGLFSGTQLPTLLQAPSDGQGGNRSNALLTSKFTMRGLVDSQ